MSKKTEELYTPPAGAPTNPLPAPKRVADPELRAMSQITRILADLTESQRVRMLRWLGDRYIPIVLGLTAPEKFDPGS